MSTSRLWLPQYRLGETQQKRCNIGPTCPLLSRPRLFLEASCTFKTIITSQHSTSQQHLLAPHPPGMNWCCPSWRRWREQYQRTPPPPWGRNCALCLMNWACAKMQDWPLIPLVWEDSALDGEPRKTECLPYNQSLATFLFDTLLPLSVLSHCRERHIPTFQYFNVSPSCLSFLSFMFLSTMGLKPPWSISIRLHKHPCKKGPKGLKYKNTWGTLWSWVFPASRLHISRVPFLTLSFSELPRFPLQQGVLQQLTEGTLWILKK